MRTHSKMRTSLNQEEENDDDDSGINVQENREE